MEPSMSEFGSDRDQLIDSMRSEINFLRSLIQAQATAKIVEREVKPTKVSRPLIEDMDGEGKNIVREMNELEFKEHKSFLQEMGIA